ncbi:MAG: hypothetical protein B0A82_23620 [Alkalinema sp. CACIAM 70d]|nr:MAG: hypothetical protein B0A82_23620 [Alkalinema sp. CACIAM 70d]
MTIQELEQQLLSLDVSERRRIARLLNLSLEPSTMEQPVNQMIDRMPEHPLRSMPIEIPTDFDEPMADLWDALEA